MASPQSLRVKGNLLTLEKLKEKLKAFEKQLTKKEWDDVYGKKYLKEEHTHYRHVENVFSKYWSLKEVRVNQHFVLKYIYVSSRVHINAMAAGLR